MCFVGVVLFGIVASVAMSYFVISQFHKAMRESFVSAAQPVVGSQSIDDMSGPTEPTGAAKQYGGSLRADVKVVTENGRSRLDCGITNTGTRALDQLVVRVRARAGDGSPVGSSGPVIRSIRKSKGLVTSTETWGNSFSKAQAPFTPAQTIRFSIELTGTGMDKVGDPKIEVMDVSFSD
jgi:hypothetical protein